MLILPEDYVVSKFYQYVGGPTKNKHSHTYQGSCPMCREGSSWLSKKRFFYIPKKNQIFCHNCGYSHTALQWVMEISNLTYNEVREEISDISNSIVHTEQKEVKPITIGTLPEDSINLSNEIQLDFYKDNRTVLECLEFLNRRKLDKACNRPKNFYLSLTDKVHKNRLVIPFVDEYGKIVHYQTRQILKDNKDIRPRYMSKVGSNKSVFNLDNVDTDFDTIFVFEGPLNSCFVKNGVAIAGIQQNSKMLFTETQKEQMDRFPFHRIIWVLDSQHLDKAAASKTKILLEMKQAVFIWPDKVGKSFKDFNDMAIAGDFTCFDPDWIIKNTKF